MVFLSVLRANIRFAYGINALPTDVITQRALDAIYAGRIVLVLNSKNSIKVKKK